MPITQIPFQDPVAPPEKNQPEQLELYAQRDWEAAYRDLDARVPHLLIQLQDDLQRSRRREAAWISLLVHILLIIFILNFPTIRKYLPFQTVVVLPQNFAKDRGITFLTLPPDEQKLTRKPNTNITSDKDRIATSKRPELDPKELRRLLPSPPPGAPGLQGPNAEQPSPPPQAMMQNSPQGAPSAPRPQFENNQTAQLQAPAQPKNSFSKYTQGTYAGSATQQAAQAAAARRGMGGGGQEGDFGLGTGARGRQVGAFDILSDTQGVDFGPYLQRILQEVRENWYHLIPESAEMKKGKLAIEFAITKDGQVADLRLVASSGDAALDRPAWGSITGSNPFPPLPSEFTGPYLALRFRFYYNPDKADLE
ncbi:MAG TPA: TonB family protein [Candidatus Sulfotelmatobacter sp.]|nr:TonB family protein [Candidatus Sulfotelmatobacter sp.]